MKQNVKILNQQPLFAIKGLLVFIFLLTTLIFSCGKDSKIDYAGLGKPSDIIPLTNSAITGELPNGLKYFILENSRPENRAHLALVVNTGSVLEEDDERGFAHFVEHLAFLDTARFPKLDLIEYLRSLGMRFGADANAYTSYNETVYHFDVPVIIDDTDGIKRIPDKALDILDDWTYAVSFNPEDVKSESLVLLEEFRTRLGAMDRVRKITLPILFAGSAYENREPIGLEYIIENATSEQLRNFYNRWYTSDNMALVFVGDFDGKELEASLSQHFNIPAAQKPVNRPKHELPPPQSTDSNFHIEIITDSELTSSSYMIYYKQEPLSNKGIQRGTLGYYRESIIDYLIDIMLTRRFAEMSDDPLSAASDSWGGIWRWAENSRFYSMGTVPKKGNAESALQELLLEKESIRRFGFTESELERAKLELVSFMEKQVSEKDRRDSRTFIRNITSHFLYGEDMADIEWELNAVISLLPGIGLKEIAAAANTYFSYNECVVFLIAPLAEEENLPSKERIKEIFSETEKTALTQRQTESLSGELLDKIPAGSLIISETIDTETGAVILTLVNGAKVILKETSNRNNEVIMYAMAKGGTINPLNNENQTEIISVNLASEMTAVSGLGPYTRTELVNKLAGKQVSFSFWASGYYRGFQGTSTTKDLRTLFEMIYLFFTEPNFDDKAIEAMLDQYRTALEHQEDDPQRFFSRELSKIITSNHPQFKPLELNDIDKVSVEQAFVFINRCINPGDYTFVFTGNINMDEMKELSSVYISSVPENISINTWADPGIIRPGKIERNLFKGKDERCFVYMGWYNPGSPTFNENKNQTAAILSEYLNILLIDEIREKLGGVYSISSGVSVSVIPKGEYQLYTYFQCNPARSSELIKAVQDRINEIFTMPVNMDTFNKAREALLMGHENALQRNLHIAQSYANSSVLYDTPLFRLNLRPEIIRLVTPQDIQDLCREMLTPGSGPVQVILFPEDWK